MQNRLTFEIEFRMNRLSVRLERLAEHFEALAGLLEQEADSGVCLKYVQECKFFIEWTGLDLDVDRVYPNSFSIRSSTPSSLFNSASWASIS
jgi:hypothetical protein